MTVKSNTVWERARSVSRGALVLFALSACGQSDSATPSTTVSETAQAYAALSASLDACQDEQDACVTAAAGDAALIAECDAAAVSCVDDTQGAQDQARTRLRDDAESCVRSCRRDRRASADAADNDDNDAGVDESAGEAGETPRRCMSRRSPEASNECKEAFFTCLDETGVRASGTMTDLDDATREAVGACVDTAHECMMNQMTARSRGRSSSARRARPSADAGVVDDAVDEAADAAAADDSARPSFRQRRASRDGGAPTPAVDAGVDM